MNIATKQPTAAKLQALKFARSLLSNAAQQKTPTTRKPSKKPPCRFTQSTIKAGSKNHRVLFRHPPKNITKNSMVAVFGEAAKKTLGGVAKDGYRKQAEKTAIQPATAEAPLFRHAETR